MELGVNYQDLHGTRDGLGPVFTRYAADRRVRLEVSSGSPRP